MDTKTHLFGENLPYIEQLYAQFLDDPSSVDPSWGPLFVEYFGGVDAAALSGQRPAFKPRSIFAGPVPTGAPAVNGHDHSPEFVDQLDNTQLVAPGRTAGFAANVDALARSYRLYGHTAAAIDPLGRGQTKPADLRMLDPQTYGLGAQELATPIQSRTLFPGQEVALSTIVARLKELYCGPIGIEYQHISDAESRKWLRHEIEVEGIATIDGPSEQTLLLQGLVDADCFETFLHKQYVGVKRFSLTGGDALIPMMRVLLREGGKLGVQEVLVGMAHRGRLNILHNIMGKSAHKMLSEFEKTPEPEAYVGSSDVKYHMGYSSDHVTPEGHTIHLSMAFNPSHLEFVNPVVIGRARAKQDRLRSPDAHSRIVPVLLHGDAAFAGQGIVPETLNLSEIDGYEVGGAVHIVINNQVGFTTNPEESRSTRYATDVAKMLEVPIFHVNGDDPEACARVMKLAMRFRQRFHKDVVIDLVCYRRYGHNEADEPRFTQPQMYEVIDALPSVRELYAKRLVAQGVLSAEQVQAMWDERWRGYAGAYEAVKERPEPKKVSTLDGLWSKYRGGAFDCREVVPTGVSLERLRQLGQIVSTLPEDVQAHRTVARVFKTRAAMAAGEQEVDWGMGESLAFASLLDEGVDVRLSGQDCVRATFSQRHAAVRDVKTGQRYWPARHIRPDQGRFTVLNSILSEAGVLGFEYGYSLDSPDSLVIWEAQFGDFVNGAQVIIDQFINSGEDKWKRLSGLVMLLPHGYEGQGPEHSSARLERFLQLCAEDNMIVCNLTTPAQYFHALRRQVHQVVRKPLIIMSPKSLLRLRQASSSLEELAHGRFEHVLPETRPSISPEAVKRVLLCSGKVYYDLLAHAEEKQITDTAIVRLEQLYPLDQDALKAAVAPFTGAKHLVWVQEEPKNMGAWYTLLPELIELFGAQPMPKLVARDASASPATGDPEAHALEQRRLMEQAFSS